VTQHLIDTPLELANCDKCKAYVFMCDVSGIRTIVDCAPLDGMDDVRRRLMMGRVVYRTLPGRKLARFSRDSTNAESGYLADHWCTGGVTGARKVETVPVGPPSAPATPGRHPDGFRHPDAPADGSQGRRGLPIMKTQRTDSSGAYPSRATRVNRPRSDPKPTRCDICREIITVRTPNVWSIEYDGRLVYGVHDSC
jgi:hypothetical protein